MGTPPAGSIGAVVVKAGTYRLYSVTSGKITGYHSIRTGGFSAFYNARGTYPWPAANSQRILVHLSTSGYRNWYFSPLQAGVTDYRKR